MSFEPFYTPSILGRREIYRERKREKVRERERRERRERAGPTRVTKGPRAPRVHGVIRPRFVFVACAAQEPGACAVSF